MLQQLERDAKAAASASASAAAPASSPPPSQSTVSWLLSLVSPPAPPAATAAAAPTPAVAPAATSSVWGAPLFGVSRLCKACKANDVGTVKQLATRDNVNVAGWLGWAPVHKAAQGGAVDCMLVLLQLGGDANARDHEGQTAMHFAAAGGFVRMVRCLLSPLANADPDARDEQRYTPLHLAALNGHADVVELLIGTGRVDVNAQTAEGLTPLHAALAGGFARCGELLIDAGAKGAALDGLGRTPFAVAKDADSLARGVVAYQAHKERIGEVKPVDLVGAVTSSNSRPATRADAEAASFRLRDGGFVTNRLDQLMVVADAPNDAEDLDHNVDTGRLARHDTFEYQGSVPNGDDDDDDDDDGDGDNDEDVDDKVSKKARPTGKSRLAVHASVAGGKSTPLVPKRRPVAADEFALNGSGGVISVSVDTVQPGAAVPGLEQPKPAADEVDEEQVDSEEVAESSDEPRGFSSAARDAFANNLALATLSDDSDDDDDDSEDAAALKPVKLKR
jgi:hypothetical protein